MVVEYTITLLNYKGETMFTIENFITGIQNTMPNIQITKDEETLFLSGPIRNGILTQAQLELLGEISLIEVQVVIDRIADGTTFHDSTLYNKVEFEVPIKSQDRMRIPSYRFFDRDQYTVSEHNYEFIVSKASPQYIIALMCFFSTHSDINFALPQIRFTMIQEDVVEEGKPIYDEAVDLKKIFSSIISKSE